MILNYRQVFDLDPNAFVSLYKCNDLEHVYNIASIVLKITKFVILQYKIIRCHILQGPNHTIDAPNDPIAPCGGIRQCRIISPDLHYIADGSYSSLDLILSAGLLLW